MKLYTRDLPVLDTLDDINSIQNVSQFKHERDGNVLYLVSQYTGIEWLFSSVLSS